SIVPMATPASKRIVIDNSPCSPGGWAKEWCKALGLADHLVRLRPGSTAQRKSRHCFIGGAAAPQAAFEQGEVLRAPLQAQVAERRQPAADVAAGTIESRQGDVRREAACLAAQAGGFAGSFHLVAQRFQPGLGQNPGPQGSCLALAGEVSHPV